MPLLPIEPPETAEVRLRDLRVGQGPIALVARVVAVDRRQITRRSDGVARTVLSGLMSDGTATVRFTWWEPPPEGIERGTVLRAVNVEVREFQGRPELSFNWRTRAGPASELELPNVTPEELPLRSLASLEPRSEGFRIEGRVVEVRPKTVSVGADRKQLFEGMLGDASGVVPFTAWSDFRLASGEALRVAGAYVRPFRDRPQLVLDERSLVQRIDGADLPTLEELRSVPRSTIAALEASAGGERVRIEGIVLGLVPPSGVVYRCPSCRRTLRQGACRVHGSVDGRPDLRARIVLDDGTGAATVNAEREDVERLLGRTLSECLAQLNQEPDPGRLEEDLLERLLGRRLAAVGRATTDDFGLSVYPSEIRPADPGPELSVATLRARLGARGG